MRFETTFALGDQLWHIRNRVTQQWVSCAFCASTGVVTGADGTIDRCGKCFGDKGHKEWLPTMWRVTEIPMTVGSVRVERRADSTEEKYMCRETGIGTGSVYDVADLFRSKTGAERACEKRNLRDGLPTSALGASEKDSL